MKMISRSILQAQKRVEGFNFDARKHLLEYDDVLNKQRQAVYRYRQSLLSRNGEKENKEILLEILNEHIDELYKTTAGRGFTEEDLPEIEKFLKNTKAVNEEGVLKIKEIIENRDFSLNGKFENIFEYLRKNIEKRAEEISGDRFLKQRILSIFDMLWMNHLEDMEALSESVRLRAYGQHDPLVEYRREGHVLFDNLFKNFRGWIFENIFRLSSKASGEENPPAEPAINNAVKINTDPKYKDAGRNDPCPCGSGKKYKKCHGA
jgi:preprotein translocase subunit SecA